MADLAPTAANVVPTTTTAKSAGTYGETVTAGMAVYKKASDSKIYKADNNVTTAEAAVVGIAINSGSAGQPADYATGGELTLGTVTGGGAGVAVCLSSTAGGLCPDGDVSSTQYYSFIGAMISATVIQIGILNTSITHA